jgi:hypothetical protein
VAKKVRVQQVSDRERCIVQALEKHLHNVVDENSEIEAAEIQILLISIKCAKIPQPIWFAI